MASVWDKGLYISIFGESHSKAVGVVVDNFPFGVFIDAKKIQKYMSLRAPFKKKIGATSRKEKDEFEILSGVFEGYTTGTPISAIIKNENFDSKNYHDFKDILRPSHADYCGKIRYGGYGDYRGGGHFSGRLTAAIVFAGSLCKAALNRKNIKIFAHIFSIGEVKDFEIESFGLEIAEFERLKEKKLAVLDDEKIADFKKEIEAAEKEGNSVGAVVECAVFGMPAGIGSPMFDGIENFISSIMFSIPAVKGIEFGKGFNFANMKGSDANDEWIFEEKVVKTKTNNNGGILGGISTGMPIIFKVVFKPTPTIKKQQNTLNLKLKKNEDISFEGFYDSCIATRGVFVVEAACHIAILSQFIYQGKF